MESLKLCLIFIVLPLTDAAVPGTFFWKPRLGIDLTMPFTKKEKEEPPKKEPKDLVVLVDSYDAGITFLALAISVDEAQPRPHLDPRRGYFYTNAYRWALRHFSEYPIWLAGKKRNYAETHKVWKKRFYYTESFMPKWMRLLFPYVTEEDWRNERKELRRFKKYSEFSYAKHYRFPSKTFNNFKSFEVGKDEASISSSGSFQSSDSN